MIFTKKHFLVIAILSLSSFYANAQYFREGDSVNLKGQKITYQFVEEGKLLVRRSWDRDIHFDLFSKELKLMNQWKYRLRSRMNSSERLMRVDYLNGELLLILQKEDGGKRRILEQVNLSRKKLRSAFYVARGTKGFYPNLHLISNKSGHFLWYESMNHPFQKHKRIDIQAFNNNFEPIWHDSIVIDYKDRLMKISRFDLNGKYKYELIVRKYFVNNLSARYGKPNTEVWHYKFDRGNETKTLLLDKSRFYTGIMIQRVTNGWEIDGMYSKKLKHRDGLFHMSFTNNKAELHHHKPLPDKIGRKMDPLGIRNKLHALVLDYRFSSDSFTYWIAEEFSYRLKGTQTNPSYELRYGSILIIKTDLQHELVDWHVIPKKQVVNSRRKHFASYQLLQDSNSVRLFMNPSQKIWLKRRSFDVIEKKANPGFYIFIESFKTPSITFQETYFPVDDKRLPLLGSIRFKSGKLFMILVDKNGKYYQPVYADFR
jgi:hypothetical protein